MLTFVCVSSVGIASAQFVSHLSSQFYREQFDRLYEVQDDGKVVSHPKSIDKSLRGVASINDAKDTLFIAFWPITNGHLKTSSTFINSDDNNVKKFAYPISWNGKRYFDVPFNANGIAAVNIPFRVRFKSRADFETDFLNAGLTGMKIWGRTRYYKSNFVKERQNYWGIGPFLAVSQQTVDSSNTGGRVLSEKKVGVISYGINLIRSWNGFNVLVAVGCDNGIGYNAKHWEENNFNGGFKPWIGFGFGFKLLDLSTKNDNEPK